MSSKKKARLRTVVRKKRGATLPGYNNLGPFNEIDVPLTKSDAEALLHDLEYAKGGKRSYWTFNQADQDFIEAIENEDDIGAKIAKRLFNAKKKLSEWNILPKDPLQSKAKQNPLLTWHGVSGNGPLTRARAKALARQSTIREHFKAKKPFNPSQLVRNSQPLLNLQEQTQAPSEKMPDQNMDGGSNPKGAYETPVDQVVDVERGIPSYQFASLPWFGIWHAKEVNFSSLDYGFRMTSVYDCINAVTVTNVQTGGGTTNVSQLSNAKPDSAQNKAQWFDFYAGLYKYYHVVSCRWSILVENLSNEPIWVHQMYVTDTLPPAKATNQDILQWPEVESHYLHAHVNYLNGDGIIANQLPIGWNGEGNAITTTNFPANPYIVNSNRSNRVQLSGQYSPGDANHQIRKDSDVETWTAINANPALLERLLIRVKSENERQNYAGTSNFGSNINLKFTVKLEYLVEFKELVDGLRWPVNTQPLTVTINTSTNTQGQTDE